MRRWIWTIFFSLLSGLSRAAGMPDPVSVNSFPSPDMGRVLLGRQLFYDPVLSGNQNIACATCHHPRLGSGDGVSLSIGEGGTGLGPDRVLAAGQTVEHRVPRNAPALWNVGAGEYVVQFYDGRVQADGNAPFGFLTPADRTIDRDMPSSLAVQALLPMLSAVEMAGQKGENPVADAVAAGDAERGWALLAARIDAIPGYRVLLDGMIGPGKPAHISDIAIALAEFIRFEFRSCDSPFDAYLAGDTAALNPAQRRGMDLFFGTAGCANCHSGGFQTDHGFHAIGVPQIGPGKGGARAYADTGRFGVTKAPEDRYRFRTPSLRNVTLTAPYGHSGAYATLEAMVRHHLDPVAGLLGYDPGQAVLQDLPVNDWQALADQEELIDIAAAIELAPMTLEDGEIADILAFLGALTDPQAARGRLGVPDTVPSGLQIDR